MEYELEFIEPQIGLIIEDDENYSKYAQWCNEHNCYIEEIEAKEDGTRQFQIKEIVVPQLTLEEEKEKKHTELKSIMQSKRSVLTCEYNGDVFDANEQAQSNMTSLMGFANLGLKEFNIRSATEVTHTLNSEQLVELAILMSKSVNDLYTVYWNKKNALYECKTVDEVQRIEWE